MSKRRPLSDEEITTFLEAHPGFEREGLAIARTYAFADYGAGVGFAVRVALLAERRDHHPDIALRYGAVRVAWSTHDAGGVTALDAELAELTDGLARA